MPHNIPNKQSLLISLQRTFNEASNGTIARLSFWRFFFFFFWSKQLLENLRMTHGIALYFGGIVCSHLLGKLSFESPLSHCWNYQIINPKKRMNMAFIWEEKWEYQEIDSKICFFHLRKIGWCHLYGFLQWYGMGWSDMYGVEIWRYRLGLVMKWGHV